MSAWQENLFSNLLVVGILLALGVIIYCRVTHKSLTDVFLEIKAMSAPQEYE